MTYFSCILHSFLKLLVIFSCLFMFKGEPLKSSPEYLCVWEFACWWTLL